MLPRLTQLKLEPNRGITLTAKIRDALGKRWSRRRAASSRNGWRALHLGLPLVLPWLLVGCFLPDQFDATVTIGGDGRVTMAYDGDLVFAMALSELKANPNAAKTELSNLRDEIAALPGFRSVRHLGGARYRVSYRNGQTLDGVVTFPPGNGSKASENAIFKVSRQADGGVEVSTLRVDTKILAQLGQLGLKPVGSLRVITELDVTHHNADQVVGDTYSWRIVDFSKDLPSLVLSSAATRKALVALNSACSDAAVSNCGTASPPATSTFEQIAPGNTASRELQASQRPESALPDPAATRDLSNALQQLRDAVHFKLEFDIQAVGEAFYAVHDIDRARWAADLAGLNIAVLKWMTGPQFGLGELLTKVRDEGWSSLDLSSPFAMLDLLARALSLQGAGKEFARGYYGPSYAEKVKAMYEMAATSENRADFVELIVGRLRGEGGPGLVPILPPKTARLRGFNELVSRVALIEEEISQVTGALLDELEEIDPDSARLDIESVAQEVRRVARAIKASTVTGQDVLPPGLSEQDTAIRLGAIAAYGSLHRDLLAAYGRGLEQEMIDARVTVAKLALKAVLVTLEMSIAAQETKVQRTVLSLEDNAYDVGSELLKIRVRDAVAEVPQSMVFALSDELSATWHLAETALEHAGSVLNLDRPPSTAAQAGDSCSHQFGRVGRGESWCGIGLGEDNRLLIDGQIVSEPLFLKLSEDDKLVLYPASPNGHYRIVEACGNGSPIRCGRPLVADLQLRVVHDTFAGKYGPEQDWLSWSPDDLHALLAYKNEGFTWLYLVRATDGRFWSLLNEGGIVLPKSLEWRDNETFHVSVAPCKRYNYDLTKCHEALSRGELEGYTVDLSSGQPSWTKSKQAEAETLITTTDGKTGSDLLDKDVSTDVSLGRLIGLRDGTILVGRIEDARLPFRSALGILEIETGDVDLFQDSSLRLTDGSVLKGDFAGGNARILTKRGTLVVPADAVVAIRNAQPETPKEDLALALGTGQGVLTGRVVDNFGKPLAGVTARVLGSALLATTNSDGYFRLPYVPGQFRVHLALEGYDSEEFGLDLAQPATYPLDDRTLARAPPANSVYLWGKDDWLPIATCEVKQVEKDSLKFSKAGRNRYVALGRPTLLVTSEALSFLDATEAKDTVLLKVESDGTIFRLARRAGWAGWMDLTQGGFTRGQKELQKTALDLQRGQIGNGRRILSRNFPPGVYALVSFASKTCFMFQTKTKELLDSEQRESERIAKAIALHRASLARGIAASSIEASDEEWRRVFVATVEIERLAKNQEAPRTSFSARERAVTKAVGFAESAEESKDWDLAAAWSKRALALDHRNVSANRISRQVTFENSATAARRAYEEEDWNRARQETASALKVSPYDPEMLNIAARARFEHEWNRALQKEEEGNLLEAWNLAKSAIETRNRHGGLGFDPAHRKAGNNRASQILTSAAASVAKEIAANTRPASKRIDEALGLFAEVDARKLHSDALVMSYRSLQAKLRMPGRYLGSHTSRIRSFVAHGKKGGSDYEVQQIFAAPDGDTFYSVVRYDNKVREWRLSKASHSRVISKGGSIFGADSRTGAVFHEGAYRSGGKPFSILRPNSDKLIEISRSGAELRGVGLTDDRKIVVLNEGGAGMSLSVWTGSKEKTLLNRKSGFCCGMTISPDRKTLAIIQNRNRLRFFDITNGVQFKRDFLSIGLPEVDWQTRIWFSARGDRIVATSKKGFRIFSFPTGKQLSHVPFDGPYAIDSDLRTLLYYGTFGDDKTMKLRAWDIDHRTEIGSRNVAKGKAITALALVGESNDIAAGFADGTIQLFSPRPPALQFAGSDASLAEAPSGNVVEAHKPASPLPRQDADDDATASTQQQAHTDGVAATQTLSGLSLYDSLNGVAAAKDGNWIVIGAQNLDDAGNSLAILRMLDSNGSLLDQRRFLPQGAVSAVLADVVELKGGDVIAAGWSRASSAANDDCWLVRLSAQGRQQWSRRLGGPGHERCYFVEVFPNGEVLAGGRTEDDRSGDGAATGIVWRLQQDGSSSRVTQQIVLAAHGTRRSAFQDATALSDGSIALVGWATNPGRGDDDLWLLRLDSEGKPLWETREGDSGPDLAMRVMPTAADELIVVGYATAKNAKARSGLVRSFDSSGRTLWSRRLNVGEGGNDKLFNGRVLDDETILVVGAASRSAKAAFEGWIVLLDRAGTVLDERLVSEPRSGRFRSLALAAGADLLLVGSARGKDDMDGWTVWLTGPTRPAALGAQFR